MPVSVIDPLEVIDVAHHKGERMSVAMWPVDFGPQYLQEIATIIQACQWICDGKTLQDAVLFSQLLLKMDELLLKPDQPEPGL